MTFETGAPSVGDRLGINYPGEGFGTWWLFNRGVTADYALIGETSGFGLVTAECGALGLEISLAGRRQYTPRLERGATWQENPNAVVHMSHLLPVLEDWSIAYERRATMQFADGTIVPKAQVIAVEGTASATTARLDIRLAPGANPRAVQKDLELRLHDAGFAAQVQPYQWSRGYIARGAEPLMQAVTEAHGTVFGTQPSRPPTPEVSMWRDVNMFNEVGIPAICYGPPRQKESFSDEGNRAVSVADMVAATKVYALTTMNVCGIQEH